MRTLILMRHAKAQDDFNYPDDFERILLSRGRSDAEKAALAFKETGIKPEIILASPAFRTSATARIFADQNQIGADKIKYENALYMSNLETYLSVFNAIKKSTVMVVGHNPFVGELAIIFSGYNIVNFTTSSIAVFQFDDEIVDLKSKAKVLFTYNR
jgi:phosphohistidine phosphatase